MSRAKAFSLIELLVVMAIIAIIAAVLFPVVGRAKRFVSRPVDTSNMHQLYLGLMMYEADTNEADPMTLLPLLPYTRSHAVFASKWDMYRVPLPDRRWWGIPLSLCVQEEVESPYKVSYAYLPTFLTDDQLRDWQKFRQHNDYGIIASPWSADPVPISNAILDGKLCGATPHEATGPPMDGAFLRIDMDGSLFTLGHNRYPNVMGNPGDLFYFR